MARIHSEDEEKPNEFHKDKHIGRSSGLLHICQFRQAKTKIVVTYPYIAALVGEIAKDRVEVTTLAKGDEDPHFVVPRPSFIGKLRQADLLIINGASLEIGFVPPLIRQATTRGSCQEPKASLICPRPSSSSKNPTVSVAPRATSIRRKPALHYRLAQCPGLARAIADALVRADRSGAGAYQKNLDAFLARWKVKSAEWDKKAEPLKGKAIIQYHRLFDYFALRTGMKIVGELEPKPGIPPPAVIWRS